MKEAEWVEPDVREAYTHWSGNGAIQDGDVCLTSSLEMLHLISAEPTSAPGGPGYLLKGTTI